MKIHRKRLALLSTSLCAFALTITIILYLLQDNISFFYTPTDVLQIKKDILYHRTMRIGGMVVKNSIRRITHDEIQFTITDFNKYITVRYKGIIPALFVENIGVVVYGKFINNRLVRAKELLVKHDERYRPPILQKVCKNNTNKKCIR